MKNKISICALFLVFSFLLILQPVDTEAFLFHATRRAVARKILRKGLNPAKFRGKARYGKGAYFSRRKSSAFSEKGSKKAVIRFKEGKKFKRTKKLDITKPNKKKMKSILGKKYDLRGAVKKGVVGPKAGRKIGSKAGRQGKVVKYKSVKDGRNNFFVPSRVYRKKPGMVRPEKIVK